MQLQDTYLHFLYRQFCLTPPAPPSTLSLTGRTGVITGSNVGLGYECAAQLLSLDLSHLILAVRTPSKGASAREALLAAHPGARIDVWELDMDSPASVVAFVARCESELEQLDFAVLNAGVFMTAYGRNQLTGFEHTLQVNYVSTALLTVLLLPVVGRTRREGAGGAGGGGGGRITIVGSETAAWARFAAQEAIQGGGEGGEGGGVLEALKEERWFNAPDTYYTSKLLQVLFLRELVKRVDDRVTVNLVNPGLCTGSQMHRHVSGVAATVVGGMKNIIGRSAAVGARTLTDAAVVQPKESHGQYLSDCRVVPMPAYCNTEHAQVVQEKVWDELMHVLAPIAPVEEILRRCS